MGFDVEEAIGKVKNKAEQIVTDERFQSRVQKAGRTVERFVEENRDLPEQMIDKARDLIEKTGIRLPK